MKTIINFCWISVLFACVGGGIIILFSLQSEMNAVQQTSAFALGIGCAIIPYCFARAVTEIFEQFPKNKL